MNKVLRKRILRELRAGLARYTALMLLIVMGMYIVTGMVAGAETVISGTEEHGRKNHVEDGQFSVFIPLNDKQIKSLEEKGVIIEKIFSIDIKAEDGSTLRVFKNRKNIDLLELDEGRYPENMNEAVLEKRYCEEHSISAGSTITASGIKFTVTGTGTTPDYDAPYEKMSDTAVSSKNFGTMFISDEQYDYLIKNTSQKAEDYCYAYRLSGNLTDEDVKKMITDMDFSYKNVSDRYYLEMVGKIIKQRDDLRDGINELYDGSKELSDGLKELYDGSKDLSDGAKNLYDGSKELSDGAKELSSGTKDLTDGAKQIAYGTKELKSGTKDLVSGLKDADEGTDALSSGIKELEIGSGELAGGLSELDSAGNELSTAADEIFVLVLTMVSDSLNAEGFEISLTPENYAQVLGQFIAATGNADLAELKAALDGISQYTSGVHEYTTGVHYVSEGSAALRNGLHEAAEGSAGLAEGMKAAAEGSAALDEGAGSLAEGTSELLKGTNSLREGAEALYDGSKELSDGAGELSNGAKELSDGAGEAYDGSKELLDGIAELRTETEKIIDDIFDFDLDNLTSFIKRSDNVRIAAAARDVEMNKLAGMAAGVIVMMLFTYVISVFVIHQIQRESSVIGALYALGGTKKNLIAHYITLPTLIAFAGGLIGSLLGFSELGISLQMEDSYAYFSIPVFEAAHPVYLIIYGIIMPPVISAIVNILVINKKLSGTALSLIKNEQKIKGNGNIYLKSRNFLRKFQIRQIIREMRTNITVLLSLLFSLIILMLGIDCYYLCVNIGKDTENDTVYEYMYTLKYPEARVPEDGEACYVESLSKKISGNNLDITIMGIDSDNPYFSVNTYTGKSNITASKAVAQKYGLKKGDQLILSDEANSMNYAFDICEICDYSAGLTVFMDIKSMRDLFGQKADYYNCVLSDRKLDIEEGRLYAVTSKNDIIKSSQIFAELMMKMVSILIIVSVIILLAVMYLMQNIMIERASSGISLVKVFGYSDKDVKKLYLNGNTLVTAAGSLIGIPASKLIIDKLFPVLITNVACGLNFTIPWYIYAVIFAGIITVHSIVNMMLVRKLKKITPAEALKNRE